MNALRNWLTRYSTGKTVLVLFILTTLVYLFMLLLTIPKAMAFAGGMKLPDMMPGGYDAGYISALFEALGAEGRNFYRTRQLPVDMIYPGLFAVSYSLILAYFLRRIEKLNTVLVYLCLLPLIAGAADYGENICFLVLLGDFPDIPVSRVAAASALSMVKSVTTAVVFISLIPLLAARVFRSVPKPGTKKMSETNSGIRPLEAKDTDELLDVWYRASREAHPFLDDDFLEQERNAIRNIYLPRTKSWVFLENGRLTGFISMMDNEIGALFVDPEFQRRGIGGQLVDLVGGLYGALEVDVFKANSTGRAFYSKHDFRQVREFTFEPTGNRMLRLRRP